MPSNDRQLNLKTILVTTGVVLTLSMGVRHGFGFWMQPISQANGWTRETYSLALALQNLLWGVFGPFAGMVADRYGTQRVVIAGAFSYMAGLLWMATVTQPALFIIGSGVFVGLGLACTAFGAVSGIIGRAAPVEKRSWAFGVSGAASSFGQFLMMPVEQQLISSIGWQQAFYALAGAVFLLMIPMTSFMREPKQGAAHAGAQQSVGEAMREALGNRSFLLLLAGYFVCGFQLVFIGAHLPAYLKDKGIVTPGVAVMALALIGLFNIFGSFTAGQLGGRMPKRYLLTSIYFARSAVIGLFLLAPLSQWSVYLFAAAIGFLWLATVPLTNGIIAGVFGLKHMSMLAGVVFLSHQVGSFIGVWLGGYLFDRLGSYDVVWGITLGLGVLAGLANMPIDERPLARSEPGLQAA